VRRAASLRQGIGCREVSNLRSPFALSDLVVKKRLDLVNGLLYTLRQSPVGRRSLNTLSRLVERGTNATTGESILALGGHPSEPGFGDLRMPDEVLVSFVVPAYNEEALIESCLTAIMAEISRTRCRVEIIVVNNGSTDATRQIAASRPNVKVIDEPQRGLVQAREAGCLAAKGQLIANIDADTILPEGWLRTALAEFAHRPDLVALSGPYIHYDLPKGAQFITAGFYRVAYIVHLLSRFLSGYGSVMQGGNFIVSRIALENAGGFSPDFRFYGEDAELARRLSKVGVVEFTFALRALSSGRRFAGEGLFKVLLRYSANYLWTHLFKHPFSSAWLDLRHAPGAYGSLESASNPPRTVEPRGVRRNSGLLKFGMIRRSERW
jgi:glycosyltransferase involved in cell wall biosynthesis